MLMYLAILSTSVAACFAVEAMDIECVKAGRSRMSRRSVKVGKIGASYPNGAAASAQ